MLRLFPARARLRQALADAQQRMAANSGAQLVEANEQLVLAALRAQTESAKVAHALSYQMDGIEVAQHLQTFTDLVTQLKDVVARINQIDPSLLASKPATPL